MKGVKKCYGLLLVSLITLGVSLSVCSGNINALKHEYAGIPLLDPQVPSSSSRGYDCSSGKCLKPASGFDISRQSVSSFGGTFTLEFNGDSYNSSYDSISPLYSSSDIIFNGLGEYRSLTSTFKYKDRSIYLSPDAYYYPSDLWDMSTLDPGNFRHQRTPFYDDIAVSSGLLRCDPFVNGAVCDGLWNVSEYVNSQVLPYFYSNDGFYIYSKAISDEGLHYNNTFSFSDMFNNSIPTFSYLQLPLFDYDGYFWDSNNLYEGRQLEFGGSFEFDGSFNWHENVNTNGSFFRIKYYGVTQSLRNSDSLITTEGSFNCTTNLITLSSTGLTRLDYSCPFTLDYDYNYVSFVLQISGNGNYVWSTDSTWRFASSFLISDNDDTPGRSFNSSLTGGGTIPGDAKNNIPSGSNDIIIDGANYSQSLINLFGFNFINPFAPLFQMFTNNDSCVQIPIIASMIHAEDSQVCPWFDSTVRNIATPVLGISSMMLVFGFAVRWLGARSGNFFEDSGSIESPGWSSTGGTAIHHGWRRKS